MEGEEYEEENEEEMERGISKNGRLTFINIRSIKLQLPFPSRIIFFPNIVLHIILNIFVSLLMSAPSAFPSSPVL